MAGEDRRVAKLTSLRAEVQQQAGRAVGVQLDLAARPTPSDLLMGATTNPDELVVMAQTSVLPGGFASLRSRASAMSARAGPRDP